MEESQVPWSDLPPQLWPVIGERLHTYIDVLRFRSVCRLWRDSLPKLNAVFPLFLSDPMNEDPLVTFHEILLFRRIIYRFSPVDHDESVCSRGWLGKIESTNLAEKRFRRPIYSTYKSKSNNERKGVNFLDFGIQEVAKSYFVGLSNNYTTCVSASKKVVVFPDSACIENCIMVGIQLLGRLKFMKHGDTCWMQIGDENRHYDDVIMYKGKIYTVDSEGGVYLIDSSSSLKFVQISPPMTMSVCGDRKHLVECGGELYIVDRFEEKKAQAGSSSGSINIHWWWGSGEKAVDFKVHRLDQERGKWVEVKDLGNQAFVLGVDCFSVSAPHFEGFERNCIYFSHELNSDLGRGPITHVFDLEKRSIMESSLQILKAPPVWLEWEPSQPANHNSLKRLRVE